MKRSGAASCGLRTEPSPFKFSAQASPNDFSPSDVYTTNAREMKVPHVPWSDDRVGTRLLADLYNRFLNMDIPQVDDLPTSSAMQEYLYLGVLGVPTPSIYNLPPLGTLMNHIYISHLGYAPPPV